MWRSERSGSGSSEKAMDTDTSGGYSSSAASMDTTAFTTSEAPFTRGWSTLTLPDVTIASMRGIRTTLSDSSQVGDDAAAEGPYNELVTTLLGDHQPGDSSFLTDNNPVLYRLLSAVTFNAWYCKKSYTERVALQRSRQFIFELMIAWMTRWYNGGAWVYPIVLLSLWAWKESVSSGFWGLLCSWRLLYHKDTVEVLLQDMGLRVQSPANFPPGKSRKVIFAVGDNCLCSFKTSFEGNREAGDGSFQHLFINWFTVPLGDSSNYPAGFDPAADGECSCAEHHDR